MGLTLLRNAAWGIAALLATPAAAQQTGNTFPPIVQAMGAKNVSTGNLAALLLDASGNLEVNCITGCGAGGGGGTSSADEAAFTFGTTSLTLGGGVFQTTATNNALTTGQGGAFQVTANRALFVNPRNAAGTEIGTSGAPFRIDPTGTTTQPVSGTVTANAGTNLNTSALALDTSVNGLLLAQGGSITSKTGPLAMGSVTTAAPSYTTAQTSPISLDTAGNLRTSVLVALPTGANTIGAVTQASGPWSTNETQINSAAISTAASGVQKVGIVGNAGAAMDAAGQNVAAPANELLSGCTFFTAPTTITSGNMSPVECDNAGNALVDLMKVGNTAITLGQAAMASSLPVAIASNQTAIPVNPAAATTGGCTAFSKNGLKATVTAIFSSRAGTLYKLELFSLDTSVEYIQVFDVATAGGVTLGTTTPTYSYPVPANGWYSVGINVAGDAFANGLQAAVTTTYGGSTAPTNGFVVNACFK